MPLLWCSVRHRYGGPECWLLRCCLLNPLIRIRRVLLEWLILGRVQKCPEYVTAFKVPYLILKRQTVYLHHRHWHGLITSGEYHGLLNYHTCHSIEDMNDSITTIEPYNYSVASQYGLFGETKLRKRFNISTDRMEIGGVIKHAWSVICEKTIIDKDTNNLTLDVIEQITIGIPTIPDNATGIICPIPFEVVTLWYRDNLDQPESSRARVNIVAPNGQASGHSQIEVNLTTHQRLRTRSRIGGLPIPSGQSGRFQFVVQLFENGNWQEVACLPLFVEIQQQVNPMSSTPELAHSDDRVDISRLPYPFGRSGLCRPLPVIAIPIQEQSVYSVKTSQSVPYGRALKFPALLLWV